MFGSLRSGNPNEENGGFPGPLERKYAVLGSVANGRSFPGWKKGWGPGPGATRSSYWPWRWYRLSAFCRVWRIAGRVVRGSIGLRWRGRFWSRWCSIFQRRSRGWNGGVRIRRFGVCVGGPSCARGQARPRFRVRSRSWRRRTGRLAGPPGGSRRGRRISWWATFCGRPRPSKPESSRRPRKRWSDQSTSGAVLAREKSDRRSGAGWSVRVR